MTRYLLMEGGVSNVNGSAMVLNQNPVAGHTIKGGEGLFSPAELWGACPKWALKQIDAGPGVRRQYLFNLGDEPIDQFLRLTQLLVGSLLGGHKCHLGACHPNILGLIPASAKKSNQRQRKFFLCGYSYPFWLTNKISNQLFPTFATFRWNW